MHVSKWPSSHRLILFIVKFFHMFIAYISPPHPSKAPLHHHHIHTHIAQREAFLTWIVVSRGNELGVLEEQEIPINVLILTFKIKVECEIYSWSISTSYCNEKHLHKCAC